MSAKDVEESGIASFNWFIDSLFLIDIFVGFRTSFMDRDGKEVLNGLLIADNYLRSSFCIDFLATLPIDYIAREAFNSDNPNLQLFGILKMGRLARLSRIIRMLVAT